MSHPDRVPAPAGLPLHEPTDRDASDVPSDRVRAYGQAMYPGGVMPGTERAAQLNIYAVMAVADREQAELRAEIERLREALANRPERTTVWQDASDEGYRLQVAHAESRSAAALHRAEVAEATIASVEVLHHIEHPTAADEAWETNPECSCGGLWPCQTFRALRSPEPTDAP